MRMYSGHWLMLAIVLIAGYFIGAKWPVLAQQVGAA